MTAGPPGGRVEAEHTRSRAVVSTRALVAIAMAAGLALRLVLLARPIGALDRVFVPDDTYYTLSIARSMARGIGPAASGTTLTSGFQPLIAFLMVPFFWLGANGTSALRIDMAILVLADTCTIGVLAWIAHRLAGRTAAIAAAAIWALSPLALVMALGGLETSLAVLMEMTLIATWIRARDDGGARNGRWVVVGTVGGLAILARVDAVVLVALVVGFELLRGRFRRALVTAGTALAVIAPWWIYCWVTFGTPIPQSGAAVRAHPFIAPWAMRILSVAAGATISGPFANDSGIKVYFFDHQPWGVALFVVLVAFFLTIGALALWRTLSRQRLSKRGDGGETRERPGRAPIVGAIALFCAALLLFYAWYGFSSYMSRYLTPIAAGTTLFVAYGLSRVLRGTLMTKSLVTVSFVTVVAVVILVIAGVSDWNLLVRTDSPVATIAASNTGGSSNGHRDPILRAIDSLPAGARVGAWQSGTLAYFADKKFPVVNLDGVVNPNAPDMRNDALMARYIKAQHIDWLVDWSVLEQPFLARGRLTLDPVPAWSTVEKFAQSNGLLITVVRIYWDPPAALKTYFALDGAIVSRFERATAPLVTSRPPALATCRRLASETLPALGSRQALDAAVEKVPDEALKTSLRTDIQGKYLLLLDCASHATLSAATLAALPRIRDLSRRVTSEIAPYEPHTDAQP